MQEDQRKQGRGYQAEISRLVAMSSAHIANVVNDGANVGDDLAHRMAENVWKLTYSELEEQAMAWSKDHPLPENKPERWVEHERRYPNLVSALRWLKEKGRLDETADGDAISRARAMALESPVDLAERTWIDIIEDLKRGIGFERRAPAEAARLATGAELHPEGLDAPPRGKKSRDPSPDPDQSHVRTKTIGAEEEKSAAHGKKR